MATEHSTATTDIDAPDADSTPTATFCDGNGHELTLLSHCPPAGDRPSLAAFYDSFDAGGRAQGIPPASPGRRDSWLDNLLENTTVETVVRDGPRVVGHATLVASAHAQPHELTVFVDADYRGAGVGSELLGALLDAGRAAGVDAVELTVEHGNRAACRLYRQHGFELDERGPFVREMRRSL